MGTAVLFVLLPFVMALLVAAVRTGFYRKQVPAAPSKRQLDPDKGKGEDVGKELAIPEDVKAPPVYELFDHPAPPIPLLAASLPSAPIGYGWEITTPPADDGDPTLRLVLLDLSTATEVDSIEANLVIARRWKYADDDTYAALYRRARALSAREVTGYQILNDGYYRRKDPQYREDHSEILGKVMMGNLITPMVDWARLLVLRYIVEHPDETKCNYMLIEAEREPESVPA